MEYLNILVPALALPSCLLCLLPMIAHAKSRSFAATVLAFATMVLNLQIFVNAIIWHESDPEKWWDGRILCDVEVKLFLGLAVAVMGSIISILRQMAAILQPDEMGAIQSSRQRRWHVAFELSFCILMPLLVMTAHYVVQPSRYRITTISGCTPSFDNSLIGILLIWTWPMFVCLLGAVYCGICISRLRRQRREMAAILSNVPSTTRSRFTRLFSLSTVLLVLYVALVVCSVFGNLSNGLHPFNWNFIYPHDWRNRIYKVPLVLIPVDRWIEIGSGYMCFAFFGLGHEAMELYKSWIRSLRRRALAIVSSEWRLRWIRSKKRINERADAPA